MYITGTHVHHWHTCTSLIHTYRDWCTCTLLINIYRVWCTSTSLAHMFITGTHIHHWCSCTELVHMYESGSQVIWTFISENLDWLRQMCLSHCCKQFVKSINRFKIIWNVCAEYSLIDWKGFFIGPLTTLFCTSRDVNDGSALVRHQLTYWQPPLESSLVHVLCKN